MTKVERYLADELATRSFGADVARHVRPGMVLLLDGPLGAGKTTFVQGFTAALGAAKAASPSFVIAHRYDGGPFPIWHLDLYRMEDEREIEDLDLELYMPPDGIALVEWAQRAAVTRWPESRLELALALEGQGRHATLRATAGAADVLKLIGSAKGVA